MRIYPVEHIWQTRDIVHPQEFYSRGRGGVPAYIFFYPFCLFLWHSEARKYPVEYHARSCNRSRLECSSRERHSLVLRQCRFSKTSIGYVEDATPRHERAAGREPEFMTTNSLVTRSLGDGTRSGFVRRGKTTFPVKLCVSLSHLLTCRNKICEDIHCNLCEMYQLLCRFQFKLFGK